METKTFISDCLGAFDETSNKIDEICGNFDIDINNYNVYSALDRCEGNYRLFSYYLIRDLYGQIILKAQSMYPKHKAAIEELITYNVNDFSSTISFNGKEVRTLDELTDAIKNFIIPKKGEEKADKKSEQWRRIGDIDLATAVLC